MDFKELSENQFEEYAKKLGILQEEDINIKTELQQEIQKKKKRCVSISQKFDDILSTIKHGSITEFYDKCATVSRDLSQLSTSIGIIPVEYGIKNKNEYIKNIVIEEKSVVFHRDENKLHIVLPELLPHRPQYDTSTKQIRYYYDIEKWRASYYKAFQKEFINGKHKIYTEKVVLYFLHHVNNGKSGNMPDTDNLEIKVITDIITEFLLFDDDHKHVAHYMDMVEDNTSYTEIIIGPLKDIINII